MKTRSLTLFLFLVLVAKIIAQVPQGIPYQAVARNAGSQPLDNRSVKVRFSVIDSIALGTAVYVESHSTTTNSLGLFSVNVGMGTPIAGTFSGINWGINSKFLKVELDTTSSGNSFVDLGTQQMMSVPYALYAGSSINSSNGVPSAGGHQQILTLCGGVPTWTTRGICPQTPNTCGAPNIHSLGLAYGSMTDQDGNVYKTIVIGTQEWMAENLKASHYRTGALIPVVTDGTIWANLTTGATCWYNNDSTTYHCPYGKLYNFYAVADARNLCPSGWHVPTDTEWTVLSTYLGGDINAGGAMKSAGAQYWSFPNANATNSSGFSGLPGGYRYIDAIFYGIGAFGSWWSASPGSTSNAGCSGLGFINVDVVRGNEAQTFGLSVRCLRD